MSINNRAAAVIEAHSQIVRDQEYGGAICAECGWSLVYRTAGVPGNAENGSQSEHLARALDAAGLLAPEMRPTRIWRAVTPEGRNWCESSSKAEVRRHARPGDTLQRLWVPPVREEWRAEGDGRADCGCAHCHPRPYSIMHICSDCGSKRCPRAAHHVNPCEADR